MLITRDEVARIARLARLDLTDTEMDALTGDLEQILAYVNRLSVPAEGAPAEPAATVTPFRDDVVTPSLPPEEALRSAADHDADFFRVPPVIERETTP